MRYTSAVNLYIHPNTKGYSKMQKHRYKKKTTLYSTLFSLFPTWYIVFPSTYSICYPLSSTCFRPHRPIIRRSKTVHAAYGILPLCRCLCHAAVEKGLSFVQTTVLSQRLHDKDICRRGEYHRLHVQFRPPDDGPVRPETCRAKRIADIVRRRKNSVSSWK